MYKFQYTSDGALKIHVFFSGTLNVNKEFQNGCTQWTNHSSDRNNM